MTADDLMSRWPAFTPGENPLDALVKLSRYYGSLPGFVIAGGGNTSVKDGATLYVKASGIALATIGSDGFVALDRGRLEVLSETELPSDPAVREARFKETILGARRTPDCGRRPRHCSMSTARCGRLPTSMPDGGRGRGS